MIYIVSQHIKLHFILSALVRRVMHSQHTKWRRRIRKAEMVEETNHFEKVEAVLRNHGYKL